MILGFKRCLPGLFLDTAGFWGLSQAWGSSWAIFKARPEAEPCSSLQFLHLPSSIHNKLLPNSIKAFKKMIYVKKYLLKNASHVTSPMLHLKRQSFVPQLKLLHYL